MLEGGWAVFGEKLDDMWKRVLLHTTGFLGRFFGDVRRWTGLFGGGRTESGERRLGAHCGG